MYEQVGYFFEFGAFGQVEDIVSPVMQIIPALADTAKGRIAGLHALKRDTLLGLKPCWFINVGHCLLLFKKMIQFLFVFVVADAFVQLFPGLHRLDHILLRAILSDVFVHILRGLVGGPECR